MAANTDSLRDIFLDVAGEETLTEEQEEGPSRSPIEERDLTLEAAVTDFARDDGLDEALDDDLGDAGDAVSEA